MSKLPSVSGKDAIKVLESFGWRVMRQTGSHVILFKEDRNVALSVPNHVPLAKTHVTKHNQSRTTVGPAFCRSLALRLSSTIREAVESLILMAGVPSFDGR